MQLTLSSLFITIVFTTILILIFNALLTCKKSYMFFRTDFLSVLAIIELTHSGECGLFFHKA